MDTERPALGFPDTITELIDFQFSLSAWLSILPASYDITLSINSNGRLVIIPFLIWENKTKQNKILVCKLIPLTSRSYELRSSVSQNLNAGNDFKICPQGVRRNPRDLMSVHS